MQDSNVLPLNTQVYSRNFQWGLLAHLLKCEDLIKAAASELRLQDFELATCQAVWEALCDYYKTHGILPGKDVFSTHVLKVINNVDGKFKSYITPEENEALANLMGYVLSVTELNPEYYKAELPKYIKWIRSSKIINQYKASIDNGADPAYMNAQLAQIERDSNGMSSSDDDIEYMVSSVDVINDSNQAREVRVSTGCSVLDGAIDHGLRPGDLGCITACPGTGKTNVLVHVCSVASVQDIDSLLITGELPGYKIKRRYYAMTAGIPGNTMKKHIDLWTPEEQSRMCMLMHPQFVGYNRCAIVDRSKESTSVNMIESLIDRWRAKVQKDRGDNSKCLLVSIDWLSYITMPHGPGSREKDDWENQVKIARELGKIAKRQGVAIWTANQGKAEADGKALLKKKDTAFGYHINDALDISIGLAIDPESRLTDDEAMNNQNVPKSRHLLFNVNKNREGVEMAVKLFQAPTLKFYDNEREFSSYFRAVSSETMNFQQFHTLTLPKALRDLYRGDETNGIGAVA